MDDLISRQAAIDDFYNVKVNEENCTEYDIGYNDGLDYAIAKLSVMPSVQGWIPVTERLPEEKQDVLLAFKHNMIVGFWENVLGDDVTWYANSGDGWMTGTEAVDNDGIPLAWMPLPEPYKGENR